MKTYWLLQGHHNNFYMRKETNPYGETRFLWSEHIYQGKWFSSKWKLRQTIKSLIKSNGPIVEANAPYRFVKIYQYRQK